MAYHPPRGASPGTSTVSPVGDAAASLRYLARYVFKVAISDARISSVDDHPVRFRYRKANSNRPRTMSLAPTEFIRRFLQHVLPTGLVKVRHFGFLSSSFRMPIEEAKTRIEMAHGFALHIPPPPDTPQPPCCRHCGGTLRYRMLMRGSQHLMRTAQLPRAAPRIDPTGFG